MENPKTSLIERLKTANNVLITVSANPSVDQLAAAIGMTLFLNKQGKHATAVFSGEVPSTLEFLQPEDTLEKNTDSLRDFIIALDKSKADKLRYKVEDRLVKIFITPYHTSITEGDLEFSQGDFNVDAILALGVHETKDLDQAITAHGRILHDATVITVNTQDDGQMGNINWVEAGASSLCEMAVEIAENLKKDGLDGQMATAFLTGIVAETERFSNQKTTSEVMNISARLMSAGANQQLVATKLEQPPEPPEIPKQETEIADKLPPKPVNNDGSLEIEHDDEVENDKKLPPIHIDEEGELRAPEEANDNSSTPPALVETPAEPEQEAADVAEEPAGQPEEETDLDNQKEDVLPPKKNDKKSKHSKIVLDPPSLGGTLTANGKPEKADPSTDPLSLPPLGGPLLSHNPPQHSNQMPPPESKTVAAPEPVKQLEIPKPVSQPVQQPIHESPVTDATPAIADLPEPKQAQPDSVDKTLTQLEEDIDSPHVRNKQPDVDQSSEVAPAIPDLEAARKAVEQIAEAAPEGPLPAAKASIGASGNLEISHDLQPTDVSQSAISFGNDYLDVSQLDPGSGLQMPAEDQLPSDPTVSSANNPLAPPPGPPPMMPPLPFPNQSQAGNPGNMHMPTHGQQPLPNAENDNDAQDPLAPL